jgi:hypothetical protein
MHILACTIVIRNPISLGDNPISAWTGELAQYPDATDHVFRLKANAVIGPKATVLDLSLSTLFLVVVQGLILFSRTLSFHGNGVGVVDKPVEQGIADDGIEKHVLLTFSRLFRVRIDNSRGRGYRHGQSLPAARLRAMRVRSSPCCRMDLML